MRRRAEHQQPAHRGGRQRRRHRRRDQPVDRPWRSARSRRRVGLRQDHGRSGRARPCPAWSEVGRRRGDDRRCSRCWRSATSPCGMRVAGWSPTFRRTRRPRSTRRCASTSSCSRSSSSTTSVAATQARKARVIEVMSEVLLPSTPEFLRRYPHQLSGGQQQRVGLAMAFACRPSVIVLDEPTTGLDVSTQAHVLDTVRQLCHAHNVAALYVTHDLAVVANARRSGCRDVRRSHRRAGPGRRAVRQPHAIRTPAISIAAAPDMSTDHEMVGLRGRAPAPGRRPVGCSFALRCELATDECRAEFPAEREVGPGRLVRCIRPFEVPESTQHVAGALVRRSPLRQPMR